MGFRVGGNDFWFALQRGTLSVWVSESTRMWETWREGRQGKVVICWTAHSGCGHGAEVGLVSVSACECENVQACVFV